jgi:8-amino-7-oxononanoate synthase
MSWDEWVDGESHAIRATGRWREVRDHDGPPPVSFASNDYLGLTRHPAVVAAACDALERWGTGSGSARLVAGSRPVHSELEVELADWKGTEAAVLFPTGYAANLGVLDALGVPDVTVFSDQRNHASIIDGCRMARADVEVYRHGDVDQLAAMLDCACGKERRLLVVTDTVFSMDGDVAPVDDLVEVCARRGALLVLDEAHAVLGPDPELAGVDHLRVGTLSKTLASLGGFVAGTRAFVDLLVNRARPFIFTTASPPAAAAAALAALRVLRSAEGDALVARLAAHVERVEPGHPSPIVPVFVGGEEQALAASAALLERGLLVPAIRPPTVAPGTSRLRVSLSAAHTDEQVDALLEALGAVAA